VMPLQRLDGVSKPQPNTVIVNSQDPNEALAKRSDRAVM
jgi:hypothetical protein